MNKLKIFIAKLNEKGDCIIFWNFDSQINLYLETVCF